MKFLIPLGGRTFLHGASDSWVLTEYRVSGVAKNAKWGTGAVADNKLSVSIVGERRQAFHWR
jgi:hypothetical protein